MIFTYILVVCLLMPISFFRCLFSTVAKKQRLDDDVAAEKTESAEISLFVTDRVTRLGRFHWVIFAYYVIVYFGQFFWKLHIQPMSSDYFSSINLCIRFDKEMGCHILADFFSNSSGHPGNDQASTVVHVCTAAGYYVKSFLFALQNL
jgi:hypothetical protein